MDIYRNLRTENYELDLFAGEYLDRFELTFSSSSLGVEEVENEFLNLHTYYSNYIDGVVLINPYLIKVKSLEIYNILGQSINQFNNIDVKNYTSFKTNINSSGTYIIKVSTENGAFSKKILVE